MRRSMASLALAFSAMAVPYPDKDPRNVGQTQAEFPFWGINGLAPNRARNLSKKHDSNAPKAIAAREKRLRRQARNLSHKNNDD